MAKSIVMNKNDTKIQKGNIPLSDSYNIVNAGNNLLLQMSNAIAKAPKSEYVINHFIYKSFQVVYPKVLPSEIDAHPEYASVRAKVNTFFSLMSKCISKPLQINQLMIEHLKFSLDDCSSYELRMLEPLYMYCNQKNVLNSAVQYICQTFKYDEAKFSKIIHKALVSTFMLYHRRLYQYRYSLYADAFFNQIVVYLFSARHTKTKGNQTILTEAELNLALYPVFMCLSSSDENLFFSIFTENYSEALRSKKDVVVLKRPELAVKTISANLGDDAKYLSTTMTPRHFNDIYNEYINRLENPNVIK